MNPETKLTDEQTREICARHNISYRSHSRLNFGFSHEVHQLNDDLIIKLFNTDSPVNFETELILLQSDLDFPKPKLIASYKATNEQDRSYIIMSFVPGFSLGSKWHEATDEQRERLIAGISKTLAVINRIDPRTISDTSDSWETIVEQRIKKLTDKLLAKNILTDEQARKVTATIEANKKYLAGSELLPVYWDIHFDNFLVNEQFELQAIIDLENVQIAALDYPLFVVQKLTDEPQKYLREEDEQYADVKDYARLKEQYRKYYPEMLAFENIDERVKLYQLIDTLHLLVDWSHDRELYDKLEALTQN
ncbi:phosphotransferase [Candidatus Saccharibacteria bacterium]|nr:phosphotransferase [Candidatus Saccharibacteria bacterium]